MEDEQQSTLKKKIQILFQLGKWPDVVKLSASYVEKYGKDMDIDMIRFKSERHMGISAPPSQQAAEAPAAAPKKEESPWVLSSAAAVDLPAQSQGGSLPHGPEAPVSPADAGGDQADVFQDGTFAGDPFSDNELIITDPFAEDEPAVNLVPGHPPVDVSGAGAAGNEPALNLAPDQPPVDVSDAGGVAISRIAALEMEESVAARPEPAANEEEVDFKDIASLTIDADPDLMTTPEPAAPAAPVSFSGEEAAPKEDLSAIAGRVDVVEEPEEERPAVRARTVTEEKNERFGSPFLASLEEKAAPRRKFISPKLVLLIVLPLLAAVALWLALTGKLSFSGAEEPATGPGPAAEVELPRRPRPTTAVPPPATAPQVDEQEKAFNEKFQQADALYKSGDLLKAWAVLLEAKKIKQTEPLRLLEELLANKIRADEEQDKQQTQVVQSQWQLETQAFDRATAQNTLSAWQDFLKAYPQGEFSSRAEKNIVLLEKKARELAEQQLLARVQQSQKIRPRSDPLIVSPADIAAMVSQKGRPPTQFEAFERGGVNMWLDYASGLMWTLWNKPMAYDKAKWWSNRVTAGYGGWRLPTAEEALALLQAERSSYAGLPAFSVWTGDTVSDQPRTAWVLKIPEGQFVAESYTQACYVWAVRKVGK